MHASERAGRVSEWEGVRMGAVSSGRGGTKRIPSEASETPVSGPGIRLRGQEEMTMSVCGEDEKERDEEALRCRGGWSGQYNAGL